MTLRVVLCLDDAAELRWLERARVLLPAAEVWLRKPSAPADAAATQADYAIVGSPGAGLFDEQRSLKALFALSAGVNAYLRLSNLPPNVPLVRLEDAGMAAPMTRYVLASVLRRALRLDTYARDQRERRWVPQEARAPSTLQTGVLGLGAIGSAIACALRDHGFAVRGYARSPRQIEGVRCMAGSNDFDAFFDGLDVLVSALPLTPETDGVLNRRTLSRMARGSHLVSIGRGAHLVDADLLALLDAGNLASATLDVFRKEPLPADHPFWGRPEIEVTPHVSGPTLIEESLVQVAGKIRQLERGEPISGIVDRQRGY